MTTSKYLDKKEEQLRRIGVLNPKSEQIHDELFRTTSFFDPRDLVQVRYEMLRRHRVDKIPVTEIIKIYSISRPTFYQIASLYEKKGIPGLVPQKPGPKGPHRCTSEIIQYVRQRMEESPYLTMKDILQEISENFGITIHRRTLERGLNKAGKGGRQIHHQ